MTVLIIKIAASILIGFFAGPAAVFVFNHMPASWLCEYGEDPAEDPRLAAGEKRIKENPWRWVYAVGFICLCLRLSLIEYSDGQLSVQPEMTTATTQLALAGLIACWLMLIIALADLKYMIIPDQFVLLLALSSIGFVPLWSEDFSLAGSGLLPAGGHLAGTAIAWPEGFWQPFIGMAIGGGFMLLCAIAGKLIFRQDAFGFGDVKLCAAIGLVLGINGTIAAVAAAVMISGFAAAAGLASGRYRKDDQKPLGPYLCGCAMAYIIIIMPLM
jgi:prepilin signal peptidase PulO-like enzyme (type II secretory pathway)